MDRGKEQGENDFLSSVMRIKKGLGEYSSIGIMVTDKEEINSSNFNRSVGVDGNFRFWKNFSLDFQGIQTYNTQEESSDQGGGFYSKFKYGYSSSKGGIGLSTWNKFLSPDFQADLGFFQRNNVIEAGGDLNGSLLIRKPSIFSLGSDINHSRIYTYEDNLLTDNAIQYTFIINPSPKDSLSFSIERHVERFADIDFSKDRLYFKSSLESIEQIQGGGSISIGDEISYDIEDPFLGSSIRWDIWVLIKPTIFSQLEFALSQSQFFDTQDNEVFNLVIPYAVARYQVNRFLSFRGIIQYHSIRKEFDTYVAANYTYQPGTSFFLGYKQIGDGKPLFFSKLSWRFGV